MPINEGKANNMKELTGIIVKALNLSQTKAELAAALGDDQPLLTKQLKTLVMHIHAGDFRFDHKYPPLADLLEIYESDKSNVLKIIGKDYTLVKLLFYYGNKKGLTGKIKLEEGGMIRPVFGDMWERLKGFYTARGNEFGGHLQESLTGLVWLAHLKDALECGHEEERQALYQEIDKPQRDLLLALRQPLFITQNTSERKDILNLGKHTGGFIRNGGYDKLNETLKKMFFREYEQEIMAVLPHLMQQVSYTIQDLDRHKDKPDVISNILTKVIPAIQPIANFLADYKCHLQVHPKTQHPTVPSDITSET